MVTILRPPTPVVDVSRHVPARLARVDQQRIAAHKLGATPHTHVDLERGFIDRLQRRDHQPVMASALFEAQPALRQNGQVLAACGLAQAKTCLAKVALPGRLEQPDLGTQRLAEARAHDEITQTQRRGISRCKQEGRQKHCSYAAAQGVRGT